MRRDPEFLFVPAKPPSNAGWPGLRPSSTVVDDMVVETDVAVTLRDGTRIYVDVRRPDQDDPVPVLIAYAPYGKHLPFPEILLANAGIEPPLPDGAPFEAPLAEYWVPHGGAVNIAARIAAESAPGEVWVSQTVRDLARTSAGVSFEDCGERELKGVGEPVRVWRVRGGG